MTTMPEETQDTAESILRPDAPGDVDTLESMIAADEAAESAAAENRDARGRFTEANKAVTPGQRQTPEVIRAKPGGTATAEAEAEPASASGSETVKPKDGEPPSPQPSPPGDEAKPKSNYEKAKERQESAWKDINTRKAELELREKALEARERGQKPAPAATTGPRAYTAADYTTAAAQWSEQAQAAEKRGDFDKADELNGLAEAARKAATTAPTERPAAEAEPEYRRQWATAKVVLPELFVPGSAMNSAMQEFISRNPGVLEQPDGVYRAALAVGRREVARLEQVSMRVPGLEQANAALSKEIKGLKDELQRVTSLPGGGGFQRGGEGARAFDQLSLKEQESQLDRELANAV